MRQRCAEKPRGPVDPTTGMLVAMIQTLCEGGELPACEQLAVINQCLVDSPFPMQVLSPTPDGFRATIRQLDLASVNVTEFRCSPAEVRRTSRHIRAADPNLYAVVYALQGRLTMSHRGHSVEHAPGELSLGDSSHPFALRTAEDTTIIRVELPMSLLPFTPSRIDRVMPLRLPSSSGLGALFAQSLARVISDATLYAPADAPRLGSIMVDLLTATLAHELEAERDVPDESRQRALLFRVDSFVERHLGDPDLSPRSIAAALHISVGYLHRLFGTRGTTVAASIRRRRLERARRDLADPSLLGIPIHRIAARWGFADHATFTRAFKSTYQVAPSDLRHPTDPRSQFRLLE
jgi:AraC-like DNA-binding protein